MPTETITRLKLSYEDELRLGYPGRFGAGLGRLEVIADLASRVRLGEATNAEVTWAVQRIRNLAEEMLATQRAVSEELTARLERESPCLGIGCDRPRGERLSSSAPGCCAACAPLAEGSLVGHEIRS